MARKTLPNEHDLIVVGSSAGMVERPLILLETLPRDFPAPIVVAQHLDPNHPSNLAEILQRQTKLKVKLVDTSLAMEAGVIYIVPPDRNVEIMDGHVSVQTDGNERPRPSVDR